RTEPGGASVRPTPNWIDEFDPWGVSCTTRKSAMVRSRRRVRIPTDRGRTAATDPHPTLAKSRRQTMPSFYSYGWVFLEDFVGVESAVDAVSDDGLAGLEVQLFGVGGSVDFVGLEGHQVGHARHFWPCMDVGPRSPLVVSDVVVARQAFVGAEGLSLGGFQCGLVNVFARHI